MGSSRGHREIYMKTSSGLQDKLTYSEASWFPSKSGHMDYQNK